MTAEGLRDAKCPPQVVTAVQALTRRPGEHYEVFVARASRIPSPGWSNGRTWPTTPILGLLPDDLAAKLRAKLIGRSHVLDTRRDRLSR